MDHRISNLARTLVRYSIDTQPGETVHIVGEAVAESLLVQIYEQVLRAGAHPFLQMLPNDLAVSYYSAARKAMLDQTPPADKAITRVADASIRVYSETNTRSLTSVNPGRQALRAKALNPIAKIRRNKRWNLTIFPTQAYAQDADMSLREFEDFVYAATYADTDNPVAAWKRIRRKQHRIITKLAGADQIRIVGPGTDLKMSIKGRSFVNSDGQKNMPSGEVFTGPLENSLEGHILYDFPVCRNGQEVDGVRLVFKKGRVVEATAEKNQKFLLAMLDIDRGARTVGELGIGTNDMIQRFTRSILFDEKIGGTVHLALGASLPGTGGVNRSALHWDMIKDLRRGGAIYVDGKLFQKDGIFVR